MTSSIALPANWEQLVPMASFLGDLIGVDQVQMQYDAINLSEVRWVVTDHPNMYITVDYYGKFSIQMRGMLGNFKILDNAYTEAAEHRVYGILFPYANGGLQFFWDWNNTQDKVAICLNHVNWPQELNHSWEELGDKQRFAADSVSQNPGEVAAGLASLNSAIDNRLRVLQRGSYTTVANGLLQAGDLSLAAGELSGAKALLDSMLGLGFADSFGEDDQIRALVAGGDHLVDSDMAAVLCNIGVQRTYNTNQNAKVDIVAVADDRVNGLEAWVSNRLTQVETNGRAQSLRLVSSTLNRLDAFRAAWHQPTPAPHIAPLGLRLTNGVPNRLFTVFGEPNVRYTIQVSTNLHDWADLPAPADAGLPYITTPIAGSRFYRALVPAP